jgi:CheY-like chemotaxis protein
MESPVTTPDAAGALSRERAERRRLASATRAARSFARSKLAPTSTNGGLGANGKPRRVLIVDDDPAMRALCSVNLQREGLVVLEEGDGLLGLMRARSERPDLVLSDVTMPGFDGFQLAAALRGDKRTRRIPLIFLSGDHEPASVVRAYELGALAYLKKPFDPPALVSLVSGVLALPGKDEQPTADGRAAAASPPAA